MKNKRFRNFIVYLHRYLGLAIGLIVAIVGLTGSVLVSHHEIEDFLVIRQYGKVTPIAERVSFDTIVGTIEKACHDRPDFAVYYQRQYYHANLCYQRSVKIIPNLVIMPP